MRIRFEITSFMENIEWLSDLSILETIGKKIKEWRLQQNLTQLSIAEKARVSLSTVQSIERGKSVSMENFIRILRILGYLNALYIFMEEKRLSPIEYLKLEKGMKQRKRASKIGGKNDRDIDSENVW